MLVGGRHGIGKKCARGTVYIYDRLAGNSETLARRGPRALNFIAGLTLTLIHKVRVVGHVFVYSKGLSDRNRLAGGSHLISKFSREIEPTVSQFLNVHAFRK